MRLRNDFHLGVIDNPQTPTKADQMIAQISILFNFFSVFRMKCIQKSVNSSMLLCFYIFMFLYLYHVLYLRATLYARIDFFQEKIKTQEKILSL
jgi:hypothetical protein